MKINLLPEGFVQYMYTFEEGIMKFIFNLTVVLIFFAGTASAGNLPNEPHIAVHGAYEITISPDIVRMSLHIAEASRNVKEARATVEERSAQLIEALTSLGIEKKDISSAQLQVTPHYNWSGREQLYVGTEVSRLISIILRDISKYDDMVRAIIDARVARISDTVLESSLEKDIRAKALQGAVNDAREKAELLASGFPEQIGSVYSVSALSPRVALRQARYQVAESARGGSFEPGVITISESIEAVFYLTK